MKESWIKLKLEFIKTVLEKQLTTTTNESERTELIRTLSEIDEQINWYNESERDLYNDRVYLITPSVLTDLLNVTTYNNYGQFRKSNGSISFEQYSTLVRNCYLFDSLPDSILEIGYSFLNDLWSDNEHFGHNNPDGTIK